MKKHTCPKCSGTGKVSYEIDNGVCYKCEGVGFIGVTSEEADRIIEERNSSKTQLSVVKRFLKSMRYGSLYEIGLDKGFKVFSMAVSSTESNLFEVPFVDNFDYVHTCENPSTTMMKYRNILNGHFCQISKLNDNKISIEFK